MAQEIGLEDLKNNMRHTQLIEEILTKPISPKEHAAKVEILKLRKQIEELTEHQKEAKPAKKGAKNDTLN